MSNKIASGDSSAIKGKISSKYSRKAEEEVLTWFDQLLGLKIDSGQYNVEDQLKNGQDLVKFAQVIQKGTLNCPDKAKKMTLKFNTNPAPFKQMENIQIFLNFCVNYGVPKTGIFKTVDLFEGHNMPQVLACIQQLGSECQRHGFNGPTIGPKPLEKNIREFTENQLRSGEGFIGSQAGSNKFASQSGMTMGSVRHVADIKADDLTREGTSYMGWHAGSGSSKGANQSGMTMGGVRHIVDIKADDLSKEGANTLGLLSATNKEATQSGMSMGGIRHISDIKVDVMSKEGSNTLGLLSGSKGANQSGMSMGGVRHAADLCGNEEMSRDSASFIGMQSGSNQGASQAGMRMGGSRHAADLTAPEKLSKEGASVIGLQMGSNKGASQSGLQMGGIRHVADVKLQEMDKSGQGIIGLQAGNVVGAATQAGMSMGGRRDIKGK